MVKHDGILVMPFCKNGVSGFAASVDMRVDNYPVTVKVEAWAATEALANDKVQYFIDGYIDLNQK